MVMVLVLIEQPFHFILHYFILIEIEETDSRPGKGFHSTLNEDSAHSVESPHKDKYGCNFVDGTPYVVFGFLISLLKEVPRLSFPNLLADDTSYMELILFEISSFVS